MTLTQADDPWTSQLAHPTVDEPWPFTRREFARLLVLRGRFREQRQDAA